MKMLNQIRPLIRAGQEMLDTVLPARCPVSGEIVEKPGLLSSTVWDRVSFIHRPFCSRCGTRFHIPVEDSQELCPSCYDHPPPFDGARAVFSYDSGSCDMILAFKHGDQTHLTASFVPWMTRAGAEFRDQVDAVVPVPLHRLRMLTRRYNQAGLLARGIARAWQKPFIPNVLVRAHYTGSQGHMTALQRMENVAYAFQVRDPNVFAGRSVLLVDDVYTTGATVSACAKALKRAGARAVYVVTIARVMGDVQVV